MTWISTCRSQAVTCSATNVGSNRNRTVHTLFSLRKRARYSSRALGAKRRQTQHSVTTWLNRMRSYLKFTHSFLSLLMINLELWVLMVLRAHSHCNWSPSCKGLVRWSPTAASQPSIWYSRKATWPRGRRVAMYLVWPWVLSSFPGGTNPGKTPLP